MGWLVLVLAGFHIQFRRRFDADVDIFRKAVDDAKPLGERSAALEFEVQTGLFAHRLLQSPQAMHQPIVLFNQHGFDRQPVGNDAQQVGEIVAIMP